MRAGQRGDSRSVDACRRVFRGWEREGHVAFANFVSDLLRVCARHIDGPVARACSPV